MGFWDNAGGAMIGGAAGLAGGLLGMAGQQQTNAQNHNEAILQRQWENNMSSTAHQREVKDLRAAGLNPILSANGGSSTPQGSMAVNQNPMTAIGTGIGTATDVFNATMQAKAIGSTMALQGAQGTALAAAATRDLSTAKQAGVSTKALESQLRAIAKEAELRAGQAEYGGKFLKFDQINSRVQQGLGTANSAKDLISPLGNLFNGKSVKIKNGQGLMNDGTKFDVNTGEILP